MINEHHFKHVELKLFGEAVLQKHVYGVLYGLCLTVDKTAIKTLLVRNFIIRFLG